MVSKKNTGLTDSLNFGLQRATGRYIARLDADDVAYPGRLKCQVDFMESRADVGLVGVNFDLIGQFGVKIGFSRLGEMEHDECLRRLRTMGPSFPHSSWLVRKEVFHQLGGYDPFFKKVQDYEFLLRCTAQYKIACLADRLIALRKTESSICHDREFTQFRYGFVAWLKHFGRQEASAIALLTADQLLDIVNRWFEREQMAQKVTGQTMITFAMYSLRARRVTDFVVNLFAALRADPLLMISRMKIKDVRRDPYKALKAYVDQFCAGFIH